MLPESLREAGDWLGRAERDLRAVAMALHGPDTLPDVAAYHAQQAVEKALKAYLAANDQPIPRTHNLDRLVALCEGIEPRFSGFAASAPALTPYATQFRYPGGPLEPALDEVREAQRVATDLLMLVRTLLFPGPPPPHSP